MGFETVAAQEYPQSRLSLKVPYGIWNPQGRSTVKPCGHSFESSLWDLKLRYRYLHHILLLVWKFPMGFETHNQKRHESHTQCLKVPYGIWNCSLADWTACLSCVWKFPMGFETVLLQTEQLVYLVFESSLWDLKLWRPVWYLGRSNQFESSLWDLKQDAAAQRERARHGLKVPYGIWNSFATKDVGYVDTGLKVPYGIWN